ncbi:hypothetical protein C1645_811487 [Glomus cerebriforme]|uniref:Uncharacterized protein n=1 Tax=Glomus cerebriforme TaxID=658196 RepID=A0A397TX78_9GLOM|nr:hypothetical protein C1645_811487 [Glomus cerebriforme]
MDEKFEEEEIKELTEVNERLISIDNLMESEELIQLKDKMKNIYIQNYYNNDKKVIILEIEKDLIIITIKDNNTTMEDIIRIKINSIDNMKKGLIGIIIVLMMIEKKGKCELKLDTKKCDK